MHTLHFYVGSPQGNGIAYRLLTNEKGGIAMLFCLTTEYTRQALDVMLEKSNTVGCAAL